MINVLFAHVAGIPIEETLGSLGPALLVAFGLASAQLRARLRPVRARAALAAPYAVCRRWMRVSGTTPLTGAGSGVDANEDLIRLHVGSGIRVLPGGSRRRSSLRGGDGRQEP